MSITNLGEQGGRAGSGRTRKALTDDEYIARIRRNSTTSRTWRTVFVLGHLAPLIVYLCFLQKFIDSLRGSGLVVPGQFERGYWLGVTLGITFGLVLVKAVHGVILHVRTAWVPRDTQLLLKYYDLAHAAPPQEPEITGEREARALHCDPASEAMRGR